MVEIHKVANESQAGAIAPRNNILLVVERPVQSQILTPSAIAVEGFAVATAGIEEVVVKLGDIIQPATYGIYRGDLASAFPESSAARA